MGLRSPAAGPGGVYFNGGSTMYANFRFNHRRVADLLVAVAVISATPWSTAIAAPKATADVSATYVTNVSGTQEVFSDGSTGITDNGTVSRSASLSQGCCSIDSLADATTSSSTSSSWSWAAAKSRSVVDVFLGTYPSQGTSINDSYDAVSKAEYTIPWRIESPTYPAGTQVPVHVRAILDGMLSIDFLSRDQENYWYYQPGDLITPGTWEGSLTHANIDVSLHLQAKRVSTGTTQNVFAFGATLDTVDGLTLNNPSQLSFLTDSSFIGSFGSTSTDPAALRYDVNINELLTEANFEEVIFYVGEVYELRLRLWTSASLGRQYTWYQTSNFVFKLTSDFSETASYSMESPDPAVSFVALDSSEPDPGALDADGDGVLDGDDNCPDVANPDQANFDGDGLGDACDSCPVDFNNDSDGDGSCDSADLCIGDDASGDADADGLCNDLDPCLGASNSDSDGDGICDDGDLCIGNDASGNTDGDAFCNDVDQCDGDDTSGDTDFDLVCDDLDVCDLDAENDADLDGFCEVDDNCDLIYNPSQSDTDADGLGDACDSDSDNDGIADDADNCPLHANEDQSDFDDDGYGDVCDLDADADGAPDAADSCLGTPVGEIVNADGCAILQLCACDATWKNHGAYVKCVAHSANDFVDVGLIGLTEHGEIVSAASSTSCGQKK